MIFQARVLFTISGGDPSRHVQKDDRGNKDDDIEEEESKGEIQKDGARWFDKK